MGLIDERKDAKAHLAPLPHGLSKGHKPSVHHNADTSVDTDTDTAGQSERAMNIIHLPSGSDIHVTCTTVNHAVHTVDESVGVAAFHNEKGSGGVGGAKSLKNNYKDSCKFLRFLGFDPSIPQKSAAVRVSLGDHGLSWYDPERPQDVPYDGPLTIFRKVTFSYGEQLDTPATENVDIHTTPLQSEHLIQFRCGSLIRDHRFSDYATSPITIVSGVCLFSSGILDDVRSFDDNQMQNEGHLVRDLVEHPTLHATEAMYRLSQTIADTIFMLRKTGSGIACSHPISVKLDVSRLAYYDLARDMLAAQRWDSASGTIWLNTVDRRHDKLFHEFSSMIVDALRQRGLGPNNAEIYVSSGARAAEQAFKSMIHEGKVPDVETCLRELSSDQLNSWPSFLDYAQVSEEQQKELTVQNLARLSYPYELTEPIFNHNNNSSGSRKLVIMVDCPFEWRIFNAATRALDRHHKMTRPGGKHLIIGAFPFPRILSTPCKNLYYYDCRREFRVDIDDWKATEFDGVSPHSARHLDTSELADLSRRLSISSTLRNSVVCPK